MLWAASAWSRGVGQILLLLAAPAVLTAATPIRELSLPATLGAGLLAVLTLIPLVAGLGRGRPGGLMPILVAIPLVVALLFALTPPGALLLASDLRLGAVIVALGAGMLMASALPR